MKSKKLFHLSLLVLFVSVSSYAGRLETSIGNLTQLQEYSNEILSEKEAHFYLFFNFLEWRDRGQYAKGKCKSSRNYKATSRQKLLKKINPLLIRTNSAVNNGKFKANGYGFGDLLALYDSLNNAKLTTCREKTTPAYSDGQELTFVQVNGRLKFFFGYGLPD